MKLDAFAIKNGTDKSSLTHGYCDFYEDALAIYIKRNKPEIFRLLEIGVFNGASLNMWSDYFRAEGCRAKVLGIDLVPEAVSYRNEARDIFVEIGDQSDGLFCADVTAKHGPFDVIIDDGSHFCSHQQKSFEHLFPQLINGGIYIIEDVCTSYWQHYTSDCSITTIEYCKNMIDDVNFRGLMANGSVSRNEKLLVDTVNSGSLRINTTIKSIHFFNSTILIYKR